jgi:Flp pilus assembly protein TadG
MKLIRTGLNKCRSRTVQKRAARGQALLELAIVVPFLLLLVVLAINFGGWFYAWTEIGSAARAAANYAALGANSAGSPGTPNGAAITAMIATDLSTLPNGSSAAVFVCWNNNGTLTQITGASGACTSTTAPADPEPGSYLSVTVDITYTYSQFFSSFSFPNLGINLFILPNTIHRRVVMRYI